MTSNFVNKSEKVGVPGPDGLLDLPYLPLHIADFLPESAVSVGRQLIGPLRCRPLELELQDQVHIMVDFIGDIEHQFLPFLHLEVHLFASNLHIFDQSLQHDHKLGHLLQLQTVQIVQVLQIVVPQPTQYPYILPVLVVEEQIFLRLQLYEHYLFVPARQNAYDHLVFLLLLFADVEGDH